MNWLMDRLGESSTIRGIIIAVVAVVIMYNPDSARLWIILGCIGYGVVEIIRKERG